MVKILVFTALFISYLAYSVIVYTNGTQRVATKTNDLAFQGKIIFQDQNCISCHQLYGLGGYLGPELTTAWSDQRRGEAYIRAMLKTGGNRMPTYGFSDEEIDAITEYLRTVDSTATTYK